MLEIESLKVLKEAKALMDRKNKVVKKRAQVIVDQIQKEEFTEKNLKFVIRKHLKFFKIFHKIRSTEKAA
jgi:hypothetical protein